MGDFVVINGKNKHKTEHIGDGKAFYPAGKVGLVVIVVAFRLAHDGVVWTIGVEAA